MLSLSLLWASRVRTGLRSLGDELKASSPPTVISIHKLWDSPGFSTHMVWVFRERTRN